MKVARLLGNQHRRGELGPGALTYTCHAGLQEVAVPIISGGEYVGCLLAGGFVVSDETSGADDDGESTLLETDRRAAPLELPADGYAAARARHPRLLQHEVSYLTELIELCAEEIVDFQTEIVRRERRVTQLEQELGTRYSYAGIIGARAVDAGALRAAR